MFPSENNFLQLLAYAKDQKQKKNIIRFINKSQFKVESKDVEWRYSFKKQSIWYFEKQKTFLKEIITRKNKNYRFMSGIYCC